MAAASEHVLRAFILPPLQQRLATRYLLPLPELEQLRLVLRLERALNVCA
jgi:hypothetical protein